MFRSIRWSLQLWHAGILTLALASFGTALYVSVMHSQFRRIDAELEAAARTLASVPPIPPPVHGRDDHGGHIPWKVENRPFFDESRLPWCFLSGLTNDGMPPRTSMSPHSLDDWAEHVRQDALHRIGQSEQDQPYFVIWDGGGAVLQASSPDLKVPTPVITSIWPPAPAGPQGGPTFRQRGLEREVIVPGPFGSTVLVGKSLRAEAANLSHLRWSLLGMGVIVLGIGLCGGWFLAVRAIRPIHQISVTAKAISASDLSQRIILSDTQSELGSLGRILNEMFARLEASFLRQARFTADASHELRTPLSIIHSHAELALTKDRTPQEHKQTLEVCLRAAKRMKSLVEELLILARADAGKLELARDHFDLKDLAEECAAQVLLRSHLRKITVETHLERVKIEGDRPRLAQLITNLLNNAIQYNCDGRNVVLALSQVGPEAVLTVKDTGIGISAEDQPHVFERFFRADKARSREVGGSGLGLAICRSIVEAHGGTITFESQMAVGTTFTVKLPVSRNVSKVPLAQTV